MTRRKGTVNTPRPTTHPPTQTLIASASVSQSASSRVVLDNSASPVKAILRQICTQFAIWLPAHFVVHGHLRGSSNRTYFQDCLSCRLRIVRASRPICVEQRGCQLLVQLFELGVVFENGWVAGRNHCCCCCFLGCLLSVVGVSKLIF